MVSLLDIAPSTETVSVRGADVAVTGISAQGFVSLLGRFPELQDLMAGKEVNASRLFEFGGNVVVAIIAAGTGFAGDEKAEVVASGLTIDEQADLLAAILKVTLPKGIVPFAEKLNGLAVTLGAGAAIKASVST